MSQGFFIVHIKDVSAQVHPVYAYAAFLLEYLIIASVSRMQCLSDRACIYELLLRLKVLQELGS